MSARRRRDVDEGARDRDDDVEGSSRAEALVRLGALTSIDVSRLAPTTLSSIMSHVRTLQRNGVAISRESLGADPIGTLDSLRDTKGRPLSSDYKRQIGMTIKRLYPDLQFSLRQYKVESYNAVSRRASPEYLNTARAILLQAARTLAIIDGGDRATPIDEQLSVYDTCVSILLTGSTSLRIHEIYDLEMSHIARIRGNEPISVRSKGGKSLRNVVPNELLLRVLEIVERNRARCVTGVRQTRTRAAVRAHYAERLANDYVILSSVDFMRKRLRELAASTDEASARVGDHRSLGFNMFRSFVTTVLTEGGGHEIARSLNNHSSVNTTLDHYAVVGPRAAESAYERLSRLVDRVAPVRSIDLDESSRVPRTERARLASRRRRVASIDERERRETSQTRSRRYEIPTFEELDVAAATATATAVVDAGRPIHPYETPQVQPGDREYAEFDSSVGLARDTIY